MQKLLIITNLITSMRIYLSIKTWYLLFLIPVSKTISLLQSYISIENKKLLTKTVYYTMNITSTEAKLFTIKCGINHTTQMQDIIHIIVIIDAILATKQIFDISIHLYQLYSITVSNNLRGFFNKNSNNSQNELLVIFET